MKWKDTCLDDVFCLPVDQSDNDPTHSSFVQHSVTLPCARRGVKLQIDDFLGY